jgi:hypothetical protein
MYDLKLNGKYFLFSKEIERISERKAKIRLEVCQKGAQPIYYKNGTKVVYYYDI